MPRSINPEKNPESFWITSAGRDVKDDVLSIVTGTFLKLTSVDLQRQLFEKYRYSSRTVRAAVKDLVSEGELNFINEAGRTFIETAFNRPVRVSRRIVLVPAGFAGEGDTDTVTVFIRQGAAFGDGRHPTTRLALMGIEVVIDELMIEQKVAAGSVLDIGTGSGVLVVAAMRLGFSRGVGVDIDPCAVSEARTNVALNGLADRVEISGQGFETIDHQFDLICANLRWPTLKSARGFIKSHLAPEGVVVISGIKTSEMTPLIDWFVETGFSYRWGASQAGWAVVVIQLDG